MPTKWIHCFLIFCLSIFFGATFANEVPGNFTPDRRVLGVLFKESAISKVMPTIAAVNSRRLTEVPVPELQLGSPEVAGRFPIAAIQVGHSAEAILSRYVLLTYPNDTDTANIARMLARSPEVQYVDHGIPVAPQANSACRPNSAGMQIWTDDINWGQNAMSLPSAHMLQRGRAFAAVVDIGIYDQHLAHVPFDEGLPYPPYLEGNFLKSFSYDAGRTSSPSISYILGEVDEYKIKRLSGDTPNCDTNTNGYHEAAFYGHGTHVAGILAAKPVSNAMGGGRACTARCPSRGTTSRLTSATTGRTLIPCSATRCGIST